MSNIENITFGVELETTVPRNTCAVGGYHHGFEVAQAPRFAGQSWKAEHDASIATMIAGHESAEFVSPILKGEEGVKHLIEFVAWLNAKGASVNRSCGFHIHIGVNSFVSTPADKARFVRIVSRLSTRNATALYAQTGTLSREQGHFCKRADSNMRKSITSACRKNNMGALRCDRYQLLNLANLETKGTVEFRCFAGTLNIEKILCHLLSVLLICKVAAARKSITAWDPTEVLTGSQAMHNLLKVRPVFSIVSAEPFDSRRVAILNKGFEMAEKYDAARAASRPIATH